MKAAGYLRVSGKSQIDGDGFPRQREAVQKFCTANGLTLERIFEEGGVSGTVAGIDRPAFFEMLTSLESGDCIVAERMDRLARELMTSEILLKECRTRGIAVYTADRGALIDVASDGADATVVLIRQVLAAVAEFDKSSLVRKLREAKNRKKAAGEMGVEGNKPYGYYPGEQAIVQLVLDWHKGGECGVGKKNFSEIANILNSMDCRNRSKNPWTPQNVRGIILNARKPKQSK